MRAETSTKLSRSERPFPVVSTSVLGILMAIGLVVAVIRFINRRAKK